MIKDIRCPTLSSTKSRDPWFESAWCSLWTALKGNLELEGLCIHTCACVHTNTRTHTQLCIQENKSTYTKKHTHTCPPWSLIDTLDLYSEHRQPCSFCPLSSPCFSLQCHQGDWISMSLDGLRSSLCPSVSSLVLASACFLLYFSLPDFLPLSVCLPYSFL